MLRNPDAAGPGTSRFIVYKTKSGGSACSGILMPPSAFCLLNLLFYTRGVNICRNDRVNTKYPEEFRGSVSPELGVSMLRNIQVSV